MFKLPSFVKLPKYKQFEYKPRYYNPIKEEIEARKKRLNETQAGYSNGENIRAAFQKKRKMGTRRTDFSQVLMILVFSLSFWLYFQVGNWAWLLLLGSLTAYFFYRKNNG